MATHLTRKEAAAFLGVKYTWLAKGACGLNSSRTIPLTRWQAHLSCFLMMQGVLSPLLKADTRYHGAWPGKQWQAAASPSHLKLQNPA